jgi:hypothetical protein
VEVQREVLRDALRIVAVAIALALLDHDHGEPGLVKPVPEIKQLVHLRALRGRGLGILRGQAQWMETTIIEIIISEAQNEVRDFKRWGIDIIPHRVVMKTGFQTTDGKRVDVDDAFKDPQHAFRIIALEGIGKSNPNQPLYTPFIYFFRHATQDDGAV